jgi:hypothetical protein
MWNQPTKAGLETFVQIFDYSLNALHGGNMRAFARHIQDSNDGEGPSSTTLGGLKTVRGAAKISAATLLALDHQLLIPLTQQRFTATELQAVVSGAIPTIRFYERDKRAPFAERFVSEIVGRGESIQSAAIAMGMDSDRLERLIALNGFGSLNLESLTLLGHYSSDLTEQQDLAALMDLHYDLPTPRVTKIVESNGKPVQLDSR